MLTAWLGGVTIDAGGSTAATAGAVVAAVVEASEAARPLGLWTATAGPTPEVKAVGTPPLCCWGVTTEPAKAGEATASSCGGGVRPTLPPTKAPSSTVVNDGAAEEAKKAAFPMAEVCNEANEAEPAKPPRSCCCCCGWVAPTPLPAAGRAGGGAWWGPAIGSTSPTSLLSAAAEDG